MKMVYKKERKYFRSFFETIKTNLTTPILRQ